MKSLYVKIDGMHCSHCEGKIKESLLKIENIKSVKFESLIAHISYENSVNIYDIIESITKEGYVTKREYISDNINDIENKFKFREFILISLCLILFLILLYKIIGFNIFNVIPNIDSSVTYGMLFIIGVFSSIHCISMCGAINLTASLGYKRDMKRPLLYNLGRLISYTLLGGIAGMIGSVLSINKVSEGIIIIISSIVMFFVALNMMGFVKLKSFHIFKFKRANKNPFIIGLCNGLMPCGPLQAMQVYAIETGSFISGAFAMFLFCLGTIPLMLFAGIAVNFVRGKGRASVNKVACSLIVILSFVMLNRGFTTLGIDIFNTNKVDGIKATVNNDYQIVSFDLDYGGYKDIILKKGVPVQMTIHVDKKYLTGCNNELEITEFNIKKKLEEGDNIIYFTPTKEGMFTYTCWMGMVKNKIIVQS